MGARKPKPTQLKEQTSVKPKLGLTRLFAAANALVPTNTVTTPTEEKNLHLEITRVQAAAKDTVFKPAKKKRQVQDDESEYGTAVVVPNAPKAKPLIDDAGTATMKVPQGTSFDMPMAASTTSVTKLLKKNEQKQSELKKRVAFAIIVFALALGTYGVLSTDATTTQIAPRKSALTQEQINERIEFYRHVTGSKLNRDRINVQLENFKQAPDLDSTARKVKPPNMMDGVPLIGEAYKNPPKKDLPYDPTYSEAKIGYGLQEEQDRQYFEKQAHEAWINDFVENARKDGFEVRIDADGNVTAKPISELGH